LTGWHARLAMGFGARTNILLLLLLLLASLTQSMYGCFAAGCTNHHLHGEVGAQSSESEGAPYSALFYATGICQNHPWSPHGHLLPAGCAAAVAVVQAPSLCVHWDPPATASMCLRPC
jgi:hypothetical protein